MNSKKFIENNFDHLVKFYNRYIRYKLRKSSSIEYYASPFMNLDGYPSDKFLFFCNKIYNKKNNTCLKTDYKKQSLSISLYKYIKIFLLFLLSKIFFSKKIKKKSVVIHTYHSDKNFDHAKYKSLKSPPLEYFKKNHVYHDINISFVSFKSLFKYKKNNVLCSICYISLLDFIKIHFLSFKIFIQNKKINLYSISYVNIFYTLVKGWGLAKLINNLDDETHYLHLWENRGYQLISDLLTKKTKKSIFLNLGVIFRVSPEYTMFNYLRHDLKSKILFMSEYNFNLVKKNLGKIDFDFFKNYRIDCNNYQIKGRNNSILLICPLSEKVTRFIYNLILDNNNKDLNIKIKLHPFLNQKNFNSKDIEPRDIYKCLHDYDTIIYVGITTAAIELYFQGKKIYKLYSDNFLDIDPLIDNNLVYKIKSLTDMKDYNYTSDEKNKQYYLGCDNKSLDKILDNI